MWVNRLHLVSIWDNKIYLEAQSFALRKIPLLQSDLQLMGASKEFQS